MACDSCWTCGDMVDTLSTKIVRLKSGALLGQCGSNDARPLVKLLDGVKSDRSLPSYDDICAIRVNGLYLLVLPNRRIFKIQTTAQAPSNWGTDVDDIGCWPVERRFTAVGSGTDFAMGAMEAGAKASDAVSIACRYDMNSRLPVHKQVLRP